MEEVSANTLPCEVGASDHCSCYHGTTETTCQLSAPVLGLETNTWSCIEFFIFICMCVSCTCICMFTCMYRGICMCMGMEAHQGRVFQSNQELQIWLVSRGNLPLRILYSCLSRLELLADYHACPTVMWILEIWIVNHTCREASSPLSHCYSSPHVDFPNITEVRELSQMLYHP